MTTTRPVRAGVDAFAWGPNGGPKAKKNFGDAMWLRVASGTKKTLIRIKSPAPRLATVLNADLILTQQNAPGGSHTVSVRATDAWKPKQVAWDNDYPGVGPVIASLTKNNPPALTEWRFDVTSYYDAVAQGQEAYGFELRNSNADELRFYSLNSGHHRPWVEVTWTTRPEKPTLLKPSFGAVSSAKPTLVCDFTDHAGDTTIKAMRVAIDALADFDPGDPDWTSGPVFVDVPQIDLSLTSYPGLSADGTPAWWRCAVQDGDDNWSSWSDPVSMWRIPKGTLNIVSPGVDPFDFVDEYTPPIVWDFSGVQTHYRMTIARARNPKRLIYDSGKVLSSVESATVPKRILKNGFRYIVTVYVWDDQEREGTPASPVYVKDEREFEVRYDDTVDPFEFIIVVQTEEDRPWNDIAFGRATAPDSVTIVRNGEAIETDLSIGDLELGEIIGGLQTYIYRDWTSRSGVLYEYEVLAEVNGKLSNGAPSVEVTNHGQGIWLADPTTGQEIVLGGRDTMETVQDDTADTWWTMGSGAPVRAVMGVNGLSGSISDAMLRSRSGLTWGGMEDDLNDFKGRVTDTYRLVWGDLNIPVVLSNVKIVPHPDTRSDQILKAVSCSWWQVDEFPFEVHV